MDDSKPGFRFPVYDAISPDDTLILVGPPNKDERGYVQFLAEESQTRRLHPVTLIDTFTIPTKNGGTWSMKRAVCEQLLPLAHSLAFNADAAGYFSILVLYRTKKHEVVRAYFLPCTSIESDAIEARGGSAMALEVVSGLAATVQDVTRTAQAHAAEIY